MMIKILIVLLSANLTCEVISAFQFAHLESQVRSLQRRIVAIEIAMDQPCQE